MSVGQTMAILNQPPKNPTNKMPNKMRPCGHLAAVAEIGSARRQSCAAKDSSGTEWHPDKDRQRTAQVGQCTETNGMEKPSSPRARTKLIKITRRRSPVAARQPTIS